MTTNSELMKCAECGAMWPEDELVYVDDIGADLCIDCAEAAEAVEVGDDEDEAAS